MKTRIVLAVIAATLVMILTACDIPKYQLYFEINSVTLSSGGNVATVNYTIENTGYDKLEDVTIKIVADFGIYEEYEWTPKTDLSVDEEATGSVTLSNYSAGYVVGSARVESSGWNIEDDDNWFD